MFQRQSVNGSNQKNKTLAAALCLLGAGWAAQPCLAQPACANSHGALSYPATVNGTVTLGAGDVRWACFSIPSMSRSAAQWLDQIALGGTLAVADSRIALYDSTGNLVASDDDDGPGSFSAISHGLRSPTRSAPGDSVPHDGRDGAALAAGAYYLAIKGFDGDVFGATGWSVTSSSPFTGTVDYRINLGFNAAPAGVGAASPDAGPVGATTALSVAVSPAGEPLSTGITVSVNASGINAGTVVLLDNGAPPDAMGGDNVFTGNAVVGALATPGLHLLPFTIGDAQLRSGMGTIAFIVGAPPANDPCAMAAVASLGANPFNTGAAATDGASSCGGTHDVWFTFTAPGSGILEAGTCGSSFDTVLSARGMCGGPEVACNNDSCSQQSELTTCVLAGQVVLFRVAGAGGQTGAGSLSLSLAGSCGGCHGVCVADFDNGSMMGVPDGGVTIEDLIYYLSIFDAGAACADVDDGTFSGVPDGGVTIDDLLYYLTRFDLGC